MKSFALSMTLACCTSILLAQPPATIPSPELAGIAHVAIRVHDLSVSTAFYEKLGFVRAFALSRDGAVYEAFIKLNDHQFIELYPATPKDSQVGFLHLCFEGRNLQSAHDYYVAKGLTPTPVKTAGAGNLLFSMLGPLSPTGLQNMEYTQYMHGSLHSRDVGQHLGEKRIALRMISVAVAVNDPIGAATFYIDKASFIQSGAAGHTLLSIPGAAGQTLEMVPAAALGFKARVTLAADTAVASAVLRARGISYRREGDSLLVDDPDGNQIVFR